MDKGRIACRAVGGATAGLLLLGSFASPSGAYPRPGVDERVSISEGGAEGVDPHQLIEDPSGICQGTLGSPAVSKGARHVAFASLLEGLADDETTLFSDVYVKDRETGEIEVVSGTRKGVAPIALPDQESASKLPTCSDGSIVIAAYPSISGNGRYVAFASSAQNLVDGDTNLAWDIFVHDRQRSTTVRASTADSGAEANGHSGPFGNGQVQGVGPVVSDNGRFVGFQSSADNLVPGDTNGKTDVFIRDLKKSETIRASVADDGSEIALGRNIGGFAMTPDARFVAFTSNDPSLGGGTELSTPTNAQKAVGAFFIYIRDVRRGTTEIGPRAVDGTGQDGNIRSSRAISDDGRFVGFTTEAPDSVPNDTNAAIPGVDGGGDEFIFDRRTGRTERVSVNPMGEETAHTPFHGTSPIPSSNGRFVAIASGANGLSTYAEDQGYEVCAEGANLLASCGGDSDVFVHDRKTGAIERISTGLRNEDLACPESILTWRNARHYCEASGPSLRDGRHIAYMSYAGNIVEGDGNSALDVFVHDFGRPLGLETGGESPGSSASDPRICVEDVCLPEEICFTIICVPPGAAVSSHDGVDDVDGILTGLGANISGASLAYRPQYADLFVTIELEHMPKVVPGASPFFYGFRLRVEERSYEIRADSVGFGTFGLFDCTDPGICMKIADLRGGYGTTGMRVVVSLPLDALELGEGDELRDVEAFSAAGTSDTGPTRIVDTLRIR